MAPEVRLFWMVGICGGYTTFSSFSLQTLTLAQGGEWARAGLNVLSPGAVPGRRVRWAICVGSPLQPARGSVTSAVPEDAMLLRIFFGERDRLAGRPLYDAIVHKARELQLGRCHRAARPDGLWPQHPHPPRQPVRHAPRTCRS